MARVTCNGPRQQHPDTFAYIYEVLIDGKDRFGVQVSQEAHDDHGEPAIRGVVERKVRQALEAGQDPKKVSVTNADFGGH